MALLDAGQLCYDVSIAATITTAQVATRTRRGPKKSVAFASHSIGSRIE